MFAADDVKVCLSSFEFSLFCQHQIPKFCPSCGSFLDLTSYSEGS